MTEQEKAALVEIATKRLAQYRKMQEHQNSDVRPRGGIDFKYEPSIALMEIALAALTPAHGWVSCDDRMPEEPDAVLVCQEGGIIFCAEYESGCFYPDEFPNLKRQGREITHWMPLPAAPEVSE